MMKALQLALSIAALAALGACENDDDDDWGPGGTSGGASGTCGLTSGDSSCDQCLGTTCATSCDACTSSSACVNLLNCVNGCTTDACVESCVHQYEAGAQPLITFLDCKTDRCGVACGSGGSKCGFSTDSPCGACINAKCFSACATCTASTACVNLLNCMVECSTDACYDGCFNAYPSGGKPLKSLMDCISASCASSC